MAAMMKLNDNLENRIDKNFISNYRLRDRIQDGSLLDIVFKDGQERCFVYEEKKKAQEDLSMLDRYFRVG